MIASMAFGQFADMTITKEIAGVNDGYILNFTANFDSAHSGATVGTIYSETFTLARFDNNDMTKKFTGCAWSEQANDSSAYLLEVIGSVWSGADMSDWTVLDTIVTATDTSYSQSSINDIVSPPYPFIKIKLSGTVANLGRNHVVNTKIYIPK